MNPLVSVIIPVYNAEKHLSECLDSVLQQSYSNIEVLCVNDSSTDNSLQILEDKNKRDPRVKIYNNKKNLGPSLSRNKGMDEATGKYILFIDADDLVGKDILVDTVDCAEKNSLELVSFDFGVISSKTAFKHREEAMRNQNDVEIKTGMEVFVSGNYHIYCWPWLYSREFLIRNDIRFKPHVLGQDTLFTFEICLKAKRVMSISNKHYYYRKEINSITTSFRAERAWSLFLVLCEIHRLWNNGKFSAKENAAIAAYYHRVWLKYRCAVMRNETDCLVDDDSPDTFIYKLLTGKQKSYYGNLSMEDINQLRCFDKVYVYGAGRASVETIEKLNTNKIVVDKIIVNSMEGNTDFFAGIKVCQLSEICCGKNDAIVVAISKQYRNGVEDALQSKGFKHIFFINVQ